MGMDLRDVEANNFIPEKAAIHDLVDTGTMLTLSSGVRTLYTNDGGTYEYQSSEQAVNFDNATGKLTCGSVVDAAVDIKIGGLMNAASANTRIRIELVMGLGGDEIPVDDIEIEINRIGVDVKGGIVFVVYNGEYAIAHGFYIYLTAIGGNIDTKNKHMLNRVH